VNKPVLFRRNRDDPELDNGSHWESRRVKAWREGLNSAALIAGLYACASPSPGSTLRPTRLEGWRSAATRPSSTNRAHPGNARLVAPPLAVFGYFHLLGAMTESGVDGHVRRRVAAEPSAAHCGCDVSDAEGCVQLRCSR
jgi:hypothetical protein